MMLGGLFIALFLTRVQLRDRINPSYRMQLSNVIFAVITGLTAGIISWRILIFLEKPRLYGYDTRLLIVGLPAVWIAVVAIGYALDPWISFMAELGKFGVIGATNAAVDFGVLNILVYWTAVTKGKYYALFKACSFSVAVVHSYLWNKYWAFESGGSVSGKEFIEFISVYLVGMIINVGVAAYVANRISPKFGLSEKAWATISAMAGSVAALLVSFVGFRVFVFIR